VFLVAPPLPTNLAAFESWARSKKQARTWLGGLLSGVTQVTLKAGDTLLLPPGKRFWQHIFLHKGRLEGGRQGCGRKGGGARVRGGRG
jgi:hypothetical protein